MSRAQAICEAFGEVLLVAGMVLSFSLSTMRLFVEVDNETFYASQRLLFNGILFRWVLPDSVRFIRKEFAR